MVSWVFVGIIVLVVVLFFNITSFRYERWWTYLIAVLLIFLLFTFFMVVRKNDLDINSFDGFLDSAKLYYTWLIGFGKNVGEITGKATDVPWSLNVTSNGSG
jgi:glucan phosphoethanolaminetransferase (alkaline phosphatase superfamily)